MDIVESFRKAFGEALVDIGEKIQNLVVLDADVAKSTMTEKFAKRFPNRFIQIGISEQDLVGTATGLAVAKKLLKNWNRGYSMCFANRQHKNEQGIIHRGN